MRKPKIDSKDDPLIAALIAKLPKANTAWPVDQQVAWLRMTAMAFGVVYGGKAVDEIPAFSPRATDLAITEATISGALLQPTTIDPKNNKSLPAFFIDAQGIAQNANGERINPKDVGGNVIVDLRGEAGDLGAIQWADGSTGVRGHQLEITTSVS